MISISEKLIRQIESHGERDYPDECGGMLIGRFDAETGKKVVELLPMQNASAVETRHNRVLILPKDVLRAERFAARKNSMSAAIIIRTRTIKPCRHSSIWIMRFRFGLTL